MNGAWSAPDWDVPLPAGVYEIEYDPETGLTRIVGRGGRVFTWWSWDGSEGSDDPALSPDAARWTPEDEA